LKKIKYFFILIILTLSLEVSARSFSLFYGFGELYNPHSYRAGMGNYEFVVNVNQGLGVIRNFYFGDAYVSFTPLFITKDKSLGVYGALGYDYTFWKWFYIKAELNTATSIKNYGASQATLGLGLVW
jgi:hypothetical protein